MSAKKVLEYLRQNKSSLIEMMGRVTYNKLQAVLTKLAEREENEGL